jgi:hypothetical protein
MRPAGRNRRVRLGGAVLDDLYPFDPPKTGKIAVKIVNHFRDEVLNEYEM